MSAAEQSKQCELSEGVSVASEQVKGRASGPVLESGFLAVLNHSAKVDSQILRGYAIAEVASFVSQYVILNPVS